MNFLRALLVLLMIAVIAWLAGLTVFVQSLQSVETEPAGAQDSDAIVVLTGGSERVSTGINLLIQHKAGKLFISGVHPSLTLERVIGNQQIPPELRACCIALGRAAETTFGNAWETRAWMVSNNLHSMRLVTANYHMPRSAMIFQAVMPEFTIVPHTVVPNNVILDDWWKRPGTTSLLVTEYCKYLVAWFRLWAGSL